MTACFPGIHRSSNRLWCLEELAVGGFASVFSARQPGADSISAVFKIPRSDRLSNPRAVYRFRYESELLSQLEHPLLPRYLASGNGDPGFPPFLCYEFIHGETLRQRLSRAMLANDAREALARIVYAGLGVVLQYLHEPGVGIAHGDVCPGNLIVDDDTVHLMDFGNAKRVAVAASEHDLYGIAQPHYISPDQARGSWGHASDLYQLGLVLYEILTGQRYNPGTDFRSCRVHAAAAEAYAPHRPISDEFWSALVASLLTPEPSQRISAADLPELP